MIRSRFFVASILVLNSVLLWGQQDEEISPSLRKLMEASRPTPLANPQLIPGIPNVLLLAAPPPSAFENVNVIEPETDASPMQNESSIAINPVNPRYLIASAVDYRASSSTWVYVSSNGGKTWVNKNLGTPAGLGFTSSNDPSVAWDYEGRGYLVYGGFDRQRTKGENGVFIAVTTDNGETWKAHTPVILHKNGTMTKDSAFEDKYYITVDNAAGSPYRGHLYIPWKRVYDRDSSTQIVITKSTDHGSTWSTPLRISDVLTGKSLDTTFGQSFPICATGSNGEVYCAWNYGPLHSIGFNSSTDGGKTWGTPRLIISYNWLGETRNTGSQYNHTLKNGTRVESYPSLTVDISNSPRRGWLYLTWAADKVPNIYFARSTDGGTTWSQPKIIQSDTTNDQYWQWMSVDATNGDLAVMYLDSRDDPANQLSRCYVSYSSDGGDTWIDRMADDEGFDIHRNPFQNGSFAGDYSGCAFHAGKVYPSHVDMRNTTTNISDNDVYTAIIEVRSPLPVENLMAKTIANEPTSIVLSWTAPTQRSFGQALNKNEYSYTLYRDGNILTTISSNELSYTDTGLAPYSRHDYTLIVVAGSDTSARRFATGYAGGSPQPGKPSLGAINAGNQNTADINVTTPSFRADGVNPLQNLKTIIIYRDSVKVAEKEVNASDTNKVIVVNDNVPERGYYSFAVSVRDSYGNESERTAPMIAYVGPIDPTWQDNFDATKLPRYLVRGGWEMTDEFALSPQNSLTESKRKQYKGLARDSITFFPVKVATALRLNFSHAAIIHPSDTAIVEVQVNNTPWTVLARYNRNDFAAWQDGQLNAADWKPETLPVSAPALSTVVVRFRFASNILNQDEGWFVDNLQFNGEVSSVENNNELTASFIYPNPASQYARIVGEDITRVEVITMMGQSLSPENVVVEQQPGSLLIDVSSWLSGTYIVRSYTAKGIQQSLLKIIR